MRRATLAILTYLSLLASIGSFMISAVPFLAELRPAVEQMRTESNEAQRTNDHRGLMDRDQEIERPSLQTEHPQRDFRDTVVEICLLTIVVCAVGIIITRLSRPRRPIH
jgi:hypothetical protein